MTPNEAKVWHAINCHDDLVRALESLIDAIDAPRFGDDSIWDNLTRDDTLDKARAVLAKAKAP